MTTAAVYDGTRLSVGDLFNAQAAQATSQRLVDVINTQAAAIERLLQRVTTLETTQRHAVAAQQHALQQMDVAVEQLEKLQHQQTRWYQTQRLHSTAIERVSSQATKHRETLDGVIDNVQRLEKTVAHSVETLQKEMAPIELVLRLHDDQFAMHDRVASLELRVETKLDKSELMRLDGIVAKIQAFAPTAAQLTTRVDKIEEDAKVAQIQAIEMGDHARRVDTTLEDIHTNLETKMEQDVFVKFCDNEFNQTIATLRQDSKATERVVNELVDRGVALETRYRMLSSKLTSVTGSIVEELHAYQSTTKNELETKLDRGFVDAALAEIRHELSCKAWRKDTSAVATKLEELQKRIQTMDHHIGLSTRFLDWFTLRGDAYERNLDVVEHQLERLAQASAPQQRQPFSNQVRYPRPSN